VHKTGDGLQPQHLSRQQSLSSSDDDKPGVAAAHQQRLDDSMDTHRLDQRSEISVRPLRFDVNLTDRQHANRLSCGGRCQLLDVMPIRSHPVVGRQTFAFVNTIDFHVFNRSI
jgi:hypothetical protein